jgi:hypothetical protein
MNLWIVAAVLFSIKTALKAVEDNGSGKSER